jgi:hypothetical protein
MKKIILLSVLIALATATFAQHPLVTNTVPRFGTTPNGDNTGRALNWGYHPFTYPSGNTLNVLTNFYNNYVQETDTLNGSLTVQIDTNGQYIPATAYTPAYFRCYQNVYVGDVVTFQFSVGKITAGHSVSFGFGYALSSAGSTLTIGRLQTADITFIFDSTGTWRELSRTIE